MNSRGTVRLGKSEIAAAPIRQLQKAWKRKQLVLILGAGVSLPYRIPNWRGLVLNMLLDVQEEFQQFWPVYRMALADWMAEYYDFELTALARVIKKELIEKAENSEDGELAFADAVRRQLYRSKNTDDAQQPTTLETVAELLKRAGKKAGCASVVTFNFDDLLQQELEKQGVPYCTVCDDSLPSGQGIPIIHPHGFLPESGEIQRPELVFAEDEYHKLSLDLFHWSATEMLTCLRRNTCLFIGLSMTDPNLRRLLDATKRTRSDQPFQRFAIMPEITSPAADEEHKAIGERIEQAAERARRITGNDQYRKTPGGVRRAVERITSEAGRYQTGLLEDLGVGVLNVRNFNDIPLLLKQIASS